MAVTADSSVPVGLPEPQREVFEGPQPSAGQFAKLKLRLLLNSTRGSAQRVATFWFGVVAGLLFALGGFITFAAVSALPDVAGVRFVAITALATAITAGWSLLPLLFFGVDETVDPARFSLLPLSRLTLAKGMLAAACVGIPATMTFAATLGLVVGALKVGGLLPGAFTVLSVLVGLLLCVVSSRAVTTTFASMLRSRRMRDLAAIVLAVMAASAALLPPAVSALMANAKIDKFLGVCQVLAWTPLSAPYAASADAVAGHWGVAAARLLIGVTAIGVLLWWWSSNLEDAMIGTTGGGARATGPAARAAGAVTMLMPALLRGLPANRFVAIVSRELRYWWREPRKRASMASLLVSSALVPLILRLQAIMNPQDTGARSAPLPVVVMFGGVVLAIVLVNQFGFDGPAYATHLLTSVPGRIDVLARGAALGLVGLPLLVAVTLGVGVISDSGSDTLAALGTETAAFGAANAVAAVLSALVPYPLPETSNPFGVNNGSGSVKGLYSLLAMIAATLISSPVLVAYVLLPASLSWLVLPSGMLWGLTAAVVGAAVTGRLLDQRGPEVLLAVTPRR